MLRNLDTIRAATFLLSAIFCVGCTARPSTAPPPGRGGAGEGGATDATKSAPKQEDHPSAAAPTPAQPPESASGQKRVPYSHAHEADSEAEWFSKLQSGLLKQYVPPAMEWKVPSTVTVVVGGEKADSSSTLPNATASSPIKVSRQMKVIVFCPENPDEFIVTAEPGTQDVQYVPEGGTTTWNWSVTPRYTGKNQKIAIRAWVLYPGGNADHELPVYTAVVNVRVPGLGESLKRLIEGDPDYWLKYGLPGGAGFVFLSGALTGIWKWLQRRKKRPNSAEPVGP